MGDCVCGADERCTGRCDKHDRDLHGYPCGECQREWREANPKRVAEIERMVSRSRGASHRQKADLVRMAVELVIDDIEATFLAHLPSKALSYCAQEDVNAGLDAMRERFGLDED